MKIAILFRGPIRPNLNSVIDKISKTSNQFAEFNVTKFLATWNSSETSELLSLNLFDCVMCEPMPSIERIRKFTYKTNLPSSTQIWRTFNMYYQSNNALNYIINQDDYDFIVHTRTDCEFEFGDYKNDWFDKDHYVTETHDGDQSLKKDWLCIASPKLMHDAWSITLKDLGDSLNIIDASERIVSNNINNRNIPCKSVKLKSIILDPLRNN